MWTSCLPILSHSKNLCTTRKRSVLKYQFGSIVSEGDPFSCFSASQPAWRQRPSTTNSCPRLKWHSKMTEYIWKTAPESGKAAALGSPSVQSIYMPVLWDIKNHGSSFPPSHHKHWDQSPIKPQKHHLRTSYTWLICDFEKSDAWHLHSTPKCNK